MIGSLRTRLLLAVGVLALAAVAAVALSARQSTRKEFERFQMLERGRESPTPDVPLPRVAAALDGRCCGDGALDAGVALVSPGEVVLVFDAMGRLQAAGANALNIGRPQASLRDGVLSLEVTTGAQGNATGVAVTLKGTPSAPIHLANGAPATVHVIRWPRPDREAPAAEFLGSVDRRLLSVTIVIALVALVVTWMITRRLTGPLVELRDATRDLAAGDLTRRVAADGSDEVGDLARGFNAMASALEHQETLRRHLVHDVAHELRTPLTALRCRVETITDGLAPDPTKALAEIQEDVAHLSQLVGDLEDLARAEAHELALSIVMLHVADVCRSAIRVAGLEGDPRLRLDLDEAITVRGDAVRVRQIVLNLLTNADRHTPEDGIISVRARSHASDVAIEIHNTGSTLTDDARARVFDRFYRADQARQRATGGSGLGLAIVKHLTEAHQGRVTVESDASGVTFRVSLPL